MDGIRTIRPVMVLAVLLCVLMVSAAAVPPLPAEFYGTVSLQGSPAPVGTVITAKINDQIRGQFTLKEPGKFGGTGIFDDKMVVAASEDDLKGGPSSVCFFIGDTKADQVIPFEPGKIQQLELSAGGSPSGIVADFEGTPTSGNAPLTVKFTDKSMGNPTMWMWDFGDGPIPMDVSCSGDGCNNIANPTHTYSTPGTYTVKLTASSQTSGSSVKEKTGYITVSGSGAGPKASFTVDKRSGPKPLTVQFTDTSSGSPTMWMWDFGDGTNDTVASPCHTYQQAGIYSVQLTASNQQGTDKKVEKEFISVTGDIPPPVAMFEGTPVSGSAPLTVQFKDLSLGPPTSYYWDFGDATISDQANPAHTYSGPGSYTVSLTVTNSGGSHTTKRENYILVGGSGGVVADFEAAPTSGAAPLTVKFSDKSTGSPTMWNWDFGDDVVIPMDADASCSGGGCNNIANPTHTYSKPGTYTVKLTASSQTGGSSTKVREGYIVVSQSGGVVADFEAAPTNGAAPLTVKFSDKSTGSPTMWMWDFGDDVVIPMDANASCSGGGCNNIANPTHTYSKPGTYTVKLTASSQTGGSSTKVREGYIIVSQSGGVVADFEAAPTNGAAPLTVKFSDKSTGSPTMWNWDFGDDVVIPMDADASCSGGSCNNIANPTHTYSKPGTYTVKLTASSQTGGSSTKVREGYIIVSQSGGGIIADFSGSPTSGSVPLTIQFSDRSIGGPIMWAWDFGDGGTDMVANPSHVYRNPGSYTVKLTASNTQSTNSVTKSGYISASQAGPGGSVKITYAPDRSQVFLNNQLQGETRFLQTFRIGNMPAGVNQLRISKPGFIDYVRDISVAAGKEAEIIADMRIKPTNNGIVSIYTYPAGSSVYVDGNLAGTGPLWLADVTPGVHSLRVTAPNYLDWNQQVNVMGGGSVTYVTAALYPSWWTPMYGYVMISSLPANGVAYMDGVAQGNTPITLSQVKPGVHTVRVELAGYKPFEQQVNVMEGRTAYVIAQMNQGGQDGVIPMSAMSTSG
ncbi:MAG: PKD domain-containing protein [Methanospirillum sp.]|uniref:PKD domain-containing protein n=1 Tax=Methanospirillum sp. TaxID=45200 RepID=UPI00236BF3E2|nr:PKD domain-containing protein [Methanospirillum sp.]MDD1728439.1 PKD domain-containing protein [Methanospirillum sp.]